MQHTAIVSALVTSHRRFLFKHGHFGSRISQQKFVRRRQADDSTPDDYYLSTHGLAFRQIAVIPDLIS
jgi:hypothetical protein